MDPLETHNTRITSTTEPYAYFTLHTVFYKQTPAVFLSTQTSLPLLSRLTTIINLMHFWLEIEISLSTTTKIILERIIGSTHG